MDSKGSPLYPVSSSLGVDQSTEDDPLVDGPLISAEALHSAIRKEFRTIPTTCSAVLLCILHVVYVVLSLCVAVLCVLKFGREQQCASALAGVSGESAIVFGKACVWALALLFSACVHRHHDQARRRGYLRFYRSTRRQKLLPVAVLSTGNMLLLLVQSSGLTEPVIVYMVMAILALELVVVLPCLLIYIVGVARFNRERLVPDVSQEEPYQSYRDINSTNETGFREACGLEEVMEKQADLIEYLKQHNTLLSKRLLNLSAQH